jgi:nicotinamidase-related amidase
MATNYFNLLTPDNSALVLIDHQPRVTLAVQSIKQEELHNNAVTLAKTGKALNLPTVISTIMATAASGPIYPEILETYPEVVQIDRHKRNAFKSPEFVAAVEATGRKNLVMAGVWTEVCLCFTALSALEHGYQVYIVTDASAGTSEVAHEMAIRRMTQAGAIPVTVQQVMSEWVDAAGPEAIGPIDEVVTHHASALGMISYYTRFLKSLEK